MDRDNSERYLGEEVYKLINEIFNRIDRIEACLDRIGGHVREMKSTLDSMYGHLDGMNSILDRIEENMSEIKESLRWVEDERSYLHLKRYLRTTTELEDLTDTYVPADRSHCFSANPKYHAVWKKRRYSL